MQFLKKIVQNFEMTLQLKKKQINEFEADFEKIKLEL